VQLVPTEGEARQEKKGRVKPWVWGVVGAGAAVVVVAVVLIAVFAGGASDPSPTLGVARGN
jgi:hypothetical protein